MTSRVCICCGEPMPSKKNELSRNPNVCASCSSLADGMEPAEGANPVLKAPAPVLLYEKPAAASKAA